VVNAIERLRLTLQNAAQSGNEPVAWILLLILTAGYYFLLPEIGDRQWSMPLEKGSGAAGEYGSVEMEPNGLDLLLDIDCWPIFCSERMIAVVNATIRRLRLTLQNAADPAVSSSTGSSS
jgi:hypothetical protein